MTKTAFLFPGQGAQHAGMGKTLRESYPAAKALFEQANDILGFDLETLCVEGPQERLDATDVSQPALFVTSLMALEMVKAETPQLVENASAAAGLSLGEYTALVFAGALSFEDGLRVVRKRGEAMQAAAEATPSGMVSILLLDVDRVRKICDEANSVGQLQIANYLCPGNTVVSGDKTACEKAIELADAAGGKPVPLAVAGAFHTPIMQPAVDRLRETLAGVEIVPPKVPVISNVDAKSHADPDEIRELLIRQVVSPVQWEASIRSLLEDGYDDFYEIGPGKVLTGLMKRISRKTACTPKNDS